MKWSKLSDNECPVARTLSIVGDRWTILIIRDCFLGLKRFDDFQTSLGMTRHVLSDRLSRLVDDGILRKEKYSNHSARFEYHLTERGEALGPAIRELASWGKTHMRVRREALLASRPNDLRSKE